MNFTCCEQIGGFKHLDVFLLEETSNWPCVVNDRNSHQINIDPNDAPVCASVLPESIRVTENSRRTEAGTRYDIEITFEYNVHSSLLEYYLDQYAAHPVIVEVCKNFKQSKMYGTDKSPLYLTYENKNGRRPEDALVIEVTIKGTTTTRPIHRLLPAAV